MAAKYAGVTWIELIICLAIVSIVSSFCLPFVPYMLRQKEIQVIEDEIKSAVKFARTQAVIIGDSLILSPLPNTDDWSKGMILFVDPGQHKYIAQAKLLHQWNWHYALIHIDWYGFQSRHYLLFSGHLSHSATNGHFKISSAHAQRTIIINRLGQISAH